MPPSKPDVKAGEAGSKRSVHRGVTRVSTDDKDVGEHTDGWKKGGKIVDRWWIGG